MKRLEAPYGFVRLELSRKEFETMGYGLKSTSNVLRELSAQSDEQEALETFVNGIVDVELQMMNEHLTLAQLRSVRVYASGAEKVQADARTTAPKPSEPGMVVFTRTQLKPLLTALGIEHVFNAYGNLEMVEGRDDRVVVVPIQVEGFEFYHLEGWEWIEVDSSTWAP